MSSSPPHSSSFKWESKWNFKDFSLGRKMPGFHLKSPPESCSVSTSPCTSPFGPIGSSRISTSTSQWLRPFTFPHPGLDLLLPRNSTDLPRQVNQNRSYDFFMNRWKLSQLCSAKRTSRSGLGVFATRSCCWSYISPMTPKVLNQYAEQVIMIILPWLG